MFQRIIGFHFFILYAIFGKVAFLIYKCVCHHQPGGDGPVLQRRNSRHLSVVVVVVVVVVGLRPSSPWWPSPNISCYGQESKAVKGVPTKSCDKQKRWRPRQPGRQLTTGSRQGAHHARCPTSKSVTVEKKSHTNARCYEPVSLIGDVQYN